jgi:hypothetical protein
MGELKKTDCESTSMGELRETDYEGTGMGELRETDCEGTGMGELNVAVRERHRMCERKETDCVSILIWLG